MKIVNYTPEKEVVWNEFVNQSKNFHFFFLRNYMEYHSDRFTDYSLMIYDDKDSLVALLPANIDGGVVYSHQGLTFGGLILKPSIKQSIVVEVLNGILIHLKNEGVTKLIYKTIPNIYHQIPSEEDLYALFVVDASLIRRDVSSSIKISNQIKYSKGRKWQLKKSASEGLEYRLTDNVDEFWLELEKVLMKSHGAKPVHTKSEIIYLQEKFPKNIKLYSTVKNGVQVAGAVIFETKTVAHTQYLYNSELGREVGALDALIDYLVKEVYVDKEYFDFGISNEDQGRFLNEGLVSQKEGFGARAVVHDFYEINIK